MTAKKADGRLAGDIKGRGDVDGRSLGPGPIGKSDIAETQLQ